MSVSPPRRPAATSFSKAARMERGQADQVLSRFRALAARASAQPSPSPSPRPQPRPAATRRRAPAGPPLDRGQAAQVLGRIRQLLAQQKTLEQTGAAVGLSKSGVHYIAVKHGFPRRTKLSPETRKAILTRLRAATATQAELSREFHVAKSTINDYSNRLTDQGTGKLKTRGLKTARRCPNPACGQLIKIWPCVACAARAAANPPPPRPSLGAA